MMQNIIVTHIWFLSTPQMTDHIDAVAPVNALKKQTLIIIFEGFIYLAQ